MSRVTWANAWKSDLSVAKLVLAEDIGRAAGLLSGWAGVRLGALDHLVEAAADQGRDVSPGLVLHAFSQSAQDNHLLGHA